MNGRFFALAAALLVAYGLFFLGQERAFRQDYMTLNPVPPVQLLRVASGYARQLVSESIFVHSAVYVGGKLEELDPDDDAPILAHNYMTAAQLYPQFRDTYYHAQSFLAGLDEASTRTVNEMLALGWKTDRSNFLYPFFQGFNCFSYLDEPGEAANIFYDASLAPNAPPLFSHMAVLLRAEGGELRVGLGSLEILAKAESDEKRRERYEEEIDMFRKALKVQQAADDFTAVNRRPPVDLKELVPDYITELPDFGAAFEMTWNPPNVGMRRERVGSFQGVRRPKKERQ